MIIELGPAAALACPVKQILKACGPNTMAIPYASALIRKRDAIVLTIDLAALFVKEQLSTSVPQLPKTKKSPSTADRYATVSLDSPNQVLARI